MSMVNLESNHLGRKQTWRSAHWEDVLGGREPAWPQVLSPLRWPVLSMKCYQQASLSQACTRSCSLFSWSWSAAHWARRCPLLAWATGGGWCRREKGSRWQTPAGKREGLPELSWSQAKGRTVEVKGCTFCHGFNYPWRNKAAPFFSLGAMIPWDNTQCNSPEWSHNK